MIGESYADKMDRKARERLTALVSLPMPDKDLIGAEGYFDPWDAFDGIIGAYSSDIDECAVEIMQAVIDRNTFAVLATTECPFAEFFLHILAGHNYVDYGTSPRGAWATFGSENVFRKFVGMWREWNVLKWSD